ncbi:hypothetical protein [Desulforamulus aquiferis]|uniref:Uncharacterized protein n=1 Tax=Desulforamulus aquiferis TaxID=1397668 RepID=A0AAW7ZEF0_9FIRM|nr:hypothetical protein [Desulforamulus aquiferis]MDO7787895.1 hypothetical protein [Desulforamulus aquiferis]
MYRENSLFPRCNVVVAAESYRKVLQALEKERAMRGQIFKHDLTKRDSKVSEIELAIGELKILYRLAVENQIK